MFLQNNCTIPDVGERKGMKEHEDNKLPFQMTFRGKFKLHEIEKEWLPLLKSRGGFRTG